MQGNILRLFEKKLPMGLYSFKGQEVTGVWRQLQNRDSHNFYFSHRTDWSGSNSIDLYSVGSLFETRASHMLS